MYGSFDDAFNSFNGVALVGTKSEEDVDGVVEPDDEPFVDEGAGDVPLGDDDGGSFRFSGVCRTLLLLLLFFLDEESIALPQCVTQHN